MKKKRGSENGLSISDFLIYVSIPAMRRKYGVKRDDFHKIERGVIDRMSPLTVVFSVLVFATGIGYLIEYFATPESSRTVYMLLDCLSLMVGCTFTFIILMLAPRYRNKTRAMDVAGELIFHIALGLSACFTLVNEINRGDFTNSSALSVSVFWVVLMIVCQIGYWRFNLIYMLSFTIAYLGVALYGYANGHLAGVASYFLFILAGDALCYILYCTYFHVALQKFLIEDKNEELLVKSTHDALTKASNRNGLRIYLNENIPVWKSNKVDVLAVMIDIDDFKMYNDTFGHLEGDRVLIELVRVLSAIPEFPHLHLFRYGGEEFLLMLTNVNTVERAEEVLETCRMKIHELRIRAPENCPRQFMTISLGGSLYTVDEGYVFHEHVADADKALYQAKETGKDKFVLHSNNLHKPD